MARDNGSKSARENGGKSAKRRTSALTLLRTDHAEVSALFSRYEKGKEKFGADQKETLAKEICQALTVHAQIEEEIFYPACKEMVEDAEDLLAEAEVEHQTLKDLIARIEAEEPGSEKYDAEVTVLGEYVKHHVKEEQGEIFAKVRRSDIDLADLGQQLETRKQELMGDMEQAA